MMMMNANDAAYYKDLLTDNVDAFYAAKFSNGEVIDGWNYCEWTLERTAAWTKRASKECYTRLGH